MRSGWAASSGATSSTPTCRRSRRRSSRSSTTSRCCCAGLGSEADTQFGVTDKRFRFNDFNLFLADDWQVSPTLTLNAGVRYEFFGWPTELDGRIGNVDFEAITNTENPAPAFIVPNNVQNTGYCGDRLGHRARRSRRPTATR